jgi:hypothetical protein
MKQEATMKKYVRPHKIYRMEKFCPEADMVFTDIQSMPNGIRKKFIKDKSNRSIYIQLSGGGEIHPHFGVSVHGLFKNGETNIVATLGAKDVELLEKLQVHMVDHIIQNRETCFPNCGTKSEAEIRAMCRPILQHAKSRPNGGSNYDRTLRTVICPADMTTPGTASISVGGINITPDNIESVKGLHWNKMLISLNGMYMQASQSCGFVHRLIRLQCDKPADTNDIQLLSDSDEEEVQGPVPKRQCTTGPKSEETEPNNVNFF